MDLWAERHDQKVWSYRSPEYGHESSFEYDGELRTHRQEQWIDAGLGNEYFNCLVTVGQNEQHFVTTAVILQRFTERHEIGIRVTDIVEEIGQNTKTNFIFDVLNRVTGFDDDHRAEHFITQLTVAQLDQPEDVRVGYGIERGWGFQYKHGGSLYILGKKKPDRCE